MNNKVNSFRKKISKLRKKICDLENELDELHNNACDTVIYTNLTLRIAELEAAVAGLRQNRDLAHATEKRLREALKGLMDLTAVAYGHQADACPQYAAARAALEGK